MLEVTLSELNHGASAVVRKVERRGGIAVVSRHGRAERRAQARADSARMHGRWWKAER